MMHSYYLHNSLGIVIIFLIGLIFSSRRKDISYKTLLRLFMSTVFTAVFILKTAIGKKVVNGAAGFFTSLYQASEKGIDFLFGSLSHLDGPWGFVFAIKVLPIIIFFSSFIAVLHYVGILKFIISKISLVVRPIFGTRGAETLCAVANSFLGQTEAPLLIRTKLASMSESEIFAVMVAGMATLSAGIMGVYSFLGFSMQHLLVSACMSISSSLLMAKLWEPEIIKTGPDKVDLDDATHDGNVLDALARGASEGIMLALNVGGMLLVTISLLGYFDEVLIACGVYLSKLTGISFFATSFSFKKFFSAVGIPFAWYLGLPQESLLDAAHVLGLKVAVNEMVAYTECVKYAFDERTKILLTYALAGFSNFSCIGIQLGGIGILAPSIRPIIGRLGVRAVIAAACANLLNAYIVSLLL